MRAQIIATDCFVLYSIKANTGARSSPVPLLSETDVNLTSETTQVVLVSSPIKKKPTKDNRCQVPVVC